MKKLKLLTLALLVLSTFKANAQDVIYKFDAPCTNTACTDNCHGLGVSTPFSVNTSVIASASNFNIGTGLVTSSSICGFSPMNGFASGFLSNPDRARWAANWTSSATINLTQHFNFTISAVLNGLVAVTRMDFQESRSGAGPRKIELRSSVDNYTSTIWQQVLPDTITTWRSWSITTGLPTFYNSVTFRFYAYNSRTSSTPAWRIDNVKVWASVTNLPIELVSFQGEAHGHGVDLSWVTASEQGNDFFTVLRSSDGINFEEEVGRVAGAGNSQSSLKYSLFDPSPRDGVSYYKLRQTNFDGTWVDSHVVSVEFTKIESILRRIGDDVSMGSQESHLVDQLGRIIGFGQTHHMNQVGTFFLRGEDGSVKRIHVTP